MPKPGHVLPVGAVAVSPEFCVDESHPHFRFAAKPSNSMAGYAAGARVDRLSFSQLRGSYQTLPWDAPVTRVEAGVAWAAMHMQGTPATMQQDPHYDDVVAEVASGGLDMGEVLAYAREWADALGIAERMRLRIDSTLVTSAWK